MHFDGWFYSMGRLRKTENANQKLSLVCYVSYFSRKPNITVDYPGF